jgi:hypothetical protein
LGAGVSWLADLVTAAAGVWARMPGSRSEGSLRGSSTRPRYGVVLQGLRLCEADAVPAPVHDPFPQRSGKQVEEGGFDTQDDAIERLTQIYAEKKRTAPSIAEARRELGQKTVAEYAKQWLPRQRRMTAYSTGEHVGSSINVHIVPRLGSRKLISVTPIVVERFLDELEADGVGQGNQVNILRTLKAILRDAYDKRAMADDPVKGVQEHVRQRVVIPDLAYLKQALAVAGDDLALEIVMMAGCGLRNGEARAVNVNNVVADDVYRVHEQIHSNTHRPAKLKHRRVGGVPGGAAAPLGPGGDRTLRGEARHDEGGVSAAGAERVLHGADGTPARPHVLREAARRGRDGDVRLPALSRLQRAGQWHPDHRCGRVDGAQVD